MNVYIREDKLKNNEELWIGFESTVLPGDLELLKTFKNFEYSEPQEYISNNKKVLLHLLKFKNLTDDRKQMLLAIVNEYIEPLDQNKVTILDIFEMFHDYFAKEDDDFIIKKLIGDLGEIIFILKLQTLGIDYKKYYQPQDFSLYDFNFNGMCIDVKTTSAKNKAIYISKRQLESTQKIGFFVCEINQLSNFHNIIELINKIIHKNQLIKQKLEY
jgi:hypothetical protein